MLEVILHMKQLSILKTFNICPIYNFMQQVTKYVKYQQICGTILDNP